MTGSADEQRTAEDAPLPGGDLRLFLTRLGIQGLLSLGILENPVTGQTAVNLGHARMIIDDLRMLREKTSGNLDEGESAALAKLLGDLEAHFVRIEAESEDDASDSPNA